MNFIVKLTISIIVIVFCTRIGKQFPSIAGLIATMPLTGFIVLVWLYLDTSANNDVIVRYTKSAMWGILPSILFFLAAFVCFKKNISLPVALSIGFGCWLIGAFFHQWFLN
ncbi:MAG: DUF3147 family protein [Candidatus Latescibacteria bacterium]|jgi:uncharacterized membrane protein (GlpM family)|nr:DUF3147 family protein [Desulfobacteraceae bacterium]MBT4485816.1 DUF3147 family protein [Candidatus Latescibacterota bacterium]